jgi:filamentous hemagglutinin
MGGTVSGKDSLNLKSVDDITNTSGTITGGVVSLTSTEGSIKNETLATGEGSENTFVTTIGKLGSITSTGNLSLDAKKDIIILGAEVKAGGDAALTAGDNVTFDTIVNKTTNSIATTSGNSLVSSSTNTTTSTERNIGSVLQTGENLSITSGADTTIAGSDVSVGGDLAVDAGGDFNVIARQDKVTTKSVKETSGFGVGGGVAGTEKVTTDDFKGTNSGSTLTVGGNTTVKADKSMTVQGSDVTIAGGADINAKEGINILDGLDETRTNTVTETTTYLKVGSSGESDSDSGSSSDSASGSGRANATASASASAEAAGSGDLKLVEMTTTSTQAGSNTSVSSNFKVGGNLKATTEGTIKVQGSNVESGGDMELDAKNVEVLAGRNEEWTNTQTKRTSIGIYSEGEAKAEAGADAQAKAGTAGTDASASASASAEASGTVTFGARTENEESTDYSLTNSSSTLKSGGNMSIKAKEAAVFVGAEVESGGDMNIEATDILNLAAQDITLKTSSKETKTAGLYIDAKVSAEASAGADVGKINVGGDPANAEVSGGVSADVSAGIRYKTEEESSTEGSVTNVTSSFKSGGNLTRNAENTIVDQGTQLEAGGDINQSAREIKEIEANDSTFSSKDSSSQDAKIGVGASASAEASVSKDGADADASAGAGLRAKYEGSINSESESATTAVTTKYKSGGSINSKSEEKTTLIGTQFESGGDINIEAGSLEYKAAKDTTSMSSDAKNMDAEIKVDLVGSVGGSLEASYGNEGESGSTSTARTGGINAGGNLNIKTTGDASFEGTQIEAGGAADIDASGSVDFKAARDTSASNKSTIDAGVELSASKGGIGAAASAGYSQEDSTSSKAQTGSIKAGSGGISISAGKDVGFEGTALKSEGDTSIDAGGNVILKAAKNTETTTSFGVEASIGAEVGKKGSAIEGSIGGSAAYANKVGSDATSIESGGKVSIKGNNVVNQAANIKAKEGTQVIGNEVKIKAEKSDISLGIQAEVSRSYGPK